MGIFCEKKTSKTPFSGPSCLLFPQVSNVKNQPGIFCRKRQFAGAKVCGGGNDFEWEEGKRNGDQHEKKQRDLRKKNNKILIGN